MTVSAKICSWLFSQICHACHACYARNESKLDFELEDVLRDLDGERCEIRRLRDAAVAVVDSYDDTMTMRDEWPEMDALRDAVEEAR